MFKTTTALLGAGVLALGLAAPADSHADDETLAFMTGAAVGYAIGDGHVRPVHERYHPRYRDHRHWPHHPGRYKRWHKRAHRWERRHERRWDRWERRWHRDWRDKRWSHHDRHEHHRSCRHHGGRDRGRHGERRHHG